MKTVPDKYFDLAIVDPPYGIGINSMNMGSRQTIKPDKRKWDVIPDIVYFGELFRTSKNQIIWGGNYFNLPARRGFVIWDKGETMYGRDFAECEMAWLSFDVSAKMFKLNPNQLDRIHPTQKPVALYKWLLKNYAKPEMKILDTHGGSFSSAIACYDFGTVEYVGCELDKDYYDAAVKRFNYHKSQVNMFEKTLDNDKKLL